MKQPFPAILIGGPPHSGKSVLIYSLTQALREREISHYALRACPDGEGDWANEIRQEFVRTIRIKGEFSPQFTQTVLGYLKKRHLPLLVDVGGRPKENQKEIFAHCTHAVLLVGDRTEGKDAYEAALAQWRSIMAEKGVQIIAEIQSTLHQPNELFVAKPHFLAGRQSDLVRGQFAKGIVFEALVDLLSSYLAQDEQQIAALHEKTKPKGTTFLDLPKLSSEFGNRDRFWQPEELTSLLETVDPQTPLAVYGRSAIWIYVALCMKIYPTQFALFDAKLGWVAPPILWERKTPEKNDVWNIELVDKEHFSLLEMNATSHYLDIAEPDKIPLLPLPADKGLMLSGRLPIWLYCAVARHYAERAAWIACYQPSLNSGVVVYSTTSDAAVSDVIPR